MNQLHIIKKPDQYKRYVLYSPSFNSYVIPGHWGLSKCILDAHIYWGVTQAKAGRTRYYNNRENWRQLYGDSAYEAKDLLIKKVVVDQVYLEDV